MRMNEDADVGIGNMIVFIALILVAAIAAGVFISISSLVKQQAEETALNSVIDISTGFKVINLAGDRGTVSKADSPYDPDSDNIGNGILSEVLTNNRLTKTELWILTCLKNETDGGIFSIVGSISGIQTDYNISNGEYISENGDVNFRIYDGSTDFEIGDDFQFNTTALIIESSIQQIEIKLTTVPGSPAINLKNTVIEITDGFVDVTLSYKDISPNSNNFDVEILRDPYGELESNLVLSEGALVKILIDCDAVGLELSPNTRVSMKIIAEHGVPTYEMFVTPDGYTERYIELV